MRLRWMWLSMLLLVISPALLLSNAAPAKAAPLRDLPSEFCYDFSDGLPYTDLATGFTVAIKNDPTYGDLGSFDGGTGNPAPSVTGVNFVESTVRAHVVITVPTGFLVNLASFETRFDDSGSAVAYLFYYDTDDTLVVNQNHGAGFSGAWNTQDGWSDGVPAENIERVEMLIEQSGGENWIDNVCLHYTGGEAPPSLTRPLAATDESPTFGIFDNEESFVDPELSFENLNLHEFYPALYAFSPYAVTGVSNSPGEPVHSADVGTVLTVVPLTVDQCGDGLAFEDMTFEMLHHSDGRGCQIAIARDVQGIGLTGSFDVTNVYVVTVQGTSSNFVYLVANAPAYVAPGDSVSAGCILGETIAIQWNPGIGFQIGASVSVVSVFLSHVFTILGQQDIPVGFTVESEISDPETNTPNPDFLSELTEYPSDVHPCNFSPAMADCMGSNPNFLRNGDGWSSFGSVYYLPGGGAILNPGAEVLFTYPLDSDSSYNVTVGEISMNGTDATTLTVRIGSAHDSFPVDNTTERVILDSASPTDPIPGTDGVYQIGVKNAGNFVVTIGYVCLTPGGTTGTPGNCTFDNYSFDLPDGQNWVNGGTIEFPGDGTAVMRDAIEATLSQSWDLPAGDYTLSARVRAHYTVPVNEVGTIAANIDLLYSFDDGEQTLGSLVFSDVDPGFKVLTTTFTLADETSDDFTFYININSGSVELDGLSIDRICLSRDGGYDGGTPPPPPFPASCEVIANPNTTDVATWIGWHWAQLNRFFTCTLMVLLNSMYQFIINTGNALLNSLRYFIMTIQRGSDWLSQRFFPWFSGQLANIASGRTSTIIESGGGGCHDLFCVLDNLIGGVFTPIANSLTHIVDFVLWLLTQAGSLLISLVTAVVTLFLMVINTILRLFGMLINFIQSIVLGFNAATPTPLPGIPQCQLDPQANAVCIGLWMLENTVFADEGQLYIPLLIGALSLALLFWAVDTFRRKLSDVGDKL